MATKCELLHIGRLFPPPSTGAIGQGEPDFPNRRHADDPGTRPPRYSTRFADPPTLELYIVLPLIASARDHRSTAGHALKPVYALNMQEMAGLYPDLAALRTSLGSERAAGWEPQPGLHLEAFAGLIEIAIQRQHLGAARQAHRDRRPGSPALQAHLFAAVAKQRNELDPRSAGGGPIGHSGGIDLHLRSIGEIELPKLNEQDASRRRAGRVIRGRRIADVRAGR